MFSPAREYSKYRAVVRFGRIDRKRRIARWKRLFRRPVHHVFSASQDLAGFRNPFQAAQTVLYLHTRFLAPQRGGHRPNYPSRRIVLQLDFELPCRDRRAHRKIARSGMVHVACREVSATRLIGPRFRYELRHATGPCDQRAPSPLRGIAFCSKSLADSRCFKHSARFFKSRHSDAQFVKHSDHTGALPHCRRSRSQHLVQTGMPLMPRRSRSPPIKATVSPAAERRSQPASLR